LQELKDTLRTISLAEEALAEEMTVNVQEIGSMKDRIAALKGQIKDTLDATNKE
jgi:hypothetical protein